MRTTTATLTLILAFLSHSGCHASVRLRGSNNSTGNKSTLGHRADYSRTVASSSDCIGMGEGTYDAIKCAIMSTYGDSECKPTATTGKWPTDTAEEESNESMCEMSAVYETECKTTGRDAYIRAAGHNTGDCDEITSAKEEEPVRMIINTDLPDWKLQANVDFSNGTCNLRADGVLCSICAVCETYPEGEFGLRASCKSEDGPTATEFANYDCISVSKLAGGKQNFVQAAVLVE